LIQCVVLCFSIEISTVPAFALFCRSNPRRGHRGTLRCKGRPGVSL